MPKQPKPLPSAEALNELFDYNPDSGGIFARVSNTNRKKGCRCDGISKSHGYRIVSSRGALFLAHRVAWKMYYGEDAPKFIDHINGVRSDNRIANLRLAEHVQNMCNRPAPPHNTSGEKGVTFRKESSRWRASITVNRKVHHLGSFQKFEDAKAAVKSARQAFHAEFAHDS